MEEEAAEVVDLSAVDPRVLVQESNPVGTCNIECPVLLLYV